MCRYVSGRESHGEEIWCPGGKVMVRRYEVREGEL